MINRLIYDGQVYYKVNDLVHVYGNKYSIYKIKKAIKESGIKVSKLKGYGNSLYIRESEVSMLEIDGSVVVMETKIKDRVETFKTSLSANSFVNLLTKMDSSINEDMVHKSLEYTDAEMKKEIKFKKYDKNIEEKYEELNSKLEKEGCQERVIGFSFLLEGETEKKSISLLVNDSDIPIVDGQALWLGEGKIGSEYLQEDEYIDLTVGKAKYRTKEDVIMLIMNVFKHNKLIKDYDGYIMFKCSEVDLDADAYEVLRIIRGEFKIIEVFGYNSDDVIEIEDYTEEYRIRTLADKLTKKATNEAIEKCKKMVSNMLNEEDYIEATYTEIDEEVDLENFEIPLILNIEVD
ncbi:hypothetical protein CHL78_012085 [Romboutsia weinsteinii]|uniref:Uncharacterized protein n=1 Tax=Romboutsia weinsteinii TaxID=2020949 RepID=A0A371J296_9FIRM|nr:hypothetical protein [Romboutsia weinsteinii]RDY26803.1 hypothetical protein CHL78_012085 [Romboutsia weinsteinii]